MADLTSGAIRQARTRYNLNQRQMAKLCGITQATFCRIENGTTVDPKSATLAKISAAIERLKKRGRK